MTKRSTGVPVICVITVLLIALLGVSACAPETDKSAPNARRPTKTAEPSAPSLKVKGVVYEVGVGDDAALIHRELGVIKKDLHANAVRLTGSNPDQLVAAAKDALEQGLAVWLTPMYPGRDERQTTAALLQVAEKAERLRRQHPELVLVVGVEMSLSMKGILQYEGDLFEFMETPAFEKAITSGEVSRRLNAALGRITAAVRPVFKGRLTYASTMFEQVDWRRFDFVGADLYREKKTEAMFPGMIENYQKYKKPVVALEFGSTAYKGSDTIPFDKAVDKVWKPKRIVGGLVRDEEAQAKEITEVVQLFEKSGLHGAFAFTFKDPTMPHDPKDPERDLDMASHSLVKTYAHGAGRGYRDPPWQPKHAFHALAEAYGRTAR